VFDLKKKVGLKVGLVLVTLLLLSLVSIVQAANIEGSSGIFWMGEYGARLSHAYDSGDASTLCTQIVLDTSPIGGIIKQTPMSILPPSGCTVSGWDTQQLTISCSPGLPPTPGFPANHVELTDILMENAEGEPMVDFTGATVTATFTGEDCVFSGTYHYRQEYFAWYQGTCGGANDIVCHEDLLSDVCGCDACTADFILKATPACDGLQLTWNGLSAGVESYVVAYYDPDINNWIEWKNVEDRSYFISNADLQSGTYSFAIVPYGLSSYYCYSNIVCDVKLPTACPNIPEFPSMFLPVTMIIGLLGAVLLIQRTREQ